MKTSTIFKAILFVVFLTLYEPLCSQEVQLGNTIYGETAWEGAGEEAAISANGLRVVVGSPRKNNFEDGLGWVNAGQINVFEWTGESWVQMGNSIDGMGLTDETGKSISISADGNRIATGGNRAGSKGSGFPRAGGVVRVYEWNGQDWEQIGSDLRGGDYTYLGNDVALSGDGNRLVATGPSPIPRFIEPALRGGYIRSYHWNGSDWIEDAAVGGEVQSDRFGTSASLSYDGNRMVVSAPRANNGTGRIYMYRWNGNFWLEEDRFEGLAIDDDYTLPVSMSADGNRVAAGFPSSRGGSARRNRVQVYERTEEGWETLGSPIVNRNAGIGYGGTVAISDDGNSVAIGDREFSSAEVRTWNGRSWVLSMGPIENPQRIPRSWYGWSVGISADGSVLAVGAFYAQRVSSLRHPGGVFVYENTNADTSLLANTIEVGLEDENTSQIVLYPNPTEGIVHLSKMVEGPFYLSDYTGTTLWSGKQINSLDLSQLEKGTYILRYKQGQDWETRQLFKE